MTPFAFRPSLFRALVITLMASLILAFTSAEVRARVMVHMAEEQGVGRFYEDKATHPSPEVARYAHMQHGRQRLELPLRTPHLLAVCHGPAQLAASFRVAKPRAPPHSPRGPPRHA